MTKFTTVAALEQHLATRSYVTGYSQTIDDITELKALSEIPSPASYPHTYRWASHIIALTGISSIAKGTAATVTATVASSTKAAAAKTDDFDDLFGDDDEEEVLNDDGENAEEAAATKARQARMEAARKLKEEKDAKDGKVKADKAKPVEKSLLVLEVKPWEADTDLEMVWNKIKEYTQEGLAWGETFKLEPVAYGIKKLVMTATIVDSLVLMDDITENIEAIEEYVQSCTVASMNKI